MDADTWRQLEISKGLLAAAVQAGASRQVVAATASALLRMALPQIPHDQEVQDRLAAIAPDIEAKLTGGTLSGTARARRNVACHNFELDGPFAAATAGGQAKILQRGKRQKHAASEQAQQQEHHDEGMTTMLAAKSALLQKKVAALVNDGLQDVVTYMSGPCLGAAIAVAGEAKMLADLQIQPKEECYKLEAGKTDDNKSEDDIKAGLNHKDELEYKHKDLSNTGKEEEELKQYHADSAEAKDADAMTAPREKETAVLEVAAVFQNEDELKTLVLAVIRDSSVGPDGLHLNTIVQKAGGALASEVKAVVASLVDEDYLYSTISAKHFAATE